MTEPAIAMMIPIQSIAQVPRIRCLARNIGLTLAAAGAGIIGANVVFGLATDIGPDTVQGGRIVSSRHAWSAASIPE